MGDGDECSRPGTSGDRDELSCTDALISNETESRVKRSTKDSFSTCGGVEHVVTCLRDYFQTA